MKNEKIEQLLLNAPAPRTPAGLLARLEAGIELPEPSRPRRESRGTGRSPLRYLFPAVSLAASLAVVAAMVLFLWPTPVAYSFAKTVEAIRNQESVHIIHKFRHGPPQPLASASGGTGTTSHHPANPFVIAETRRKVSQGREMIYTSGNGREQIQNGPLGLIIHTDTGERDFYLYGWGNLPAASYLNPEDCFLELEEQARRGEIAYRIAEKLDGSGNIEIAVRHRALEASDLMRLWVDGKTYLPVRLQIISTAFPEFGEEVVMNEFELIGYGADFDEAIFAIEPTEAELQKFGLTREDLTDLPARTTSIEITGDDGTRFTGTIRDGRGEREIAGVLPTILVEVPEGEMFIDLRSESGARERFGVRMGGGDFMTQAERIVIFLSEDGTTRGISSVPLDAQDVEAFMKRNR